MTIRNKDKLDAQLSEKLGVDINFDVSKRKIQVNESNIYLYSINGLTDSLIISEVIQKLLDIERTLDKSIINTIENNLLTMQVSKETDLDKVVIGVMSGQLAINVEGYKESLIVDTRKYPGRNPDESPNEPTIRGSRDCFIENININVGLVRRRIRDESIRLESMQVGEITKLDVVLCYLDKKVNKDVLDKVKLRLESTTAENASMSHQAIIDILFPKKNNPLPYVKIVERSDSFASQISKGYIGILIDNSPLGLILPITLFDLFMVSETHYNNHNSSLIYITVHYLSMLCFLIVIPFWYYLALNPDVIPKSLEYLKVGDEYKVPVIIEILVIGVVYQTLTASQYITPKLLKGGLALSITIILSSAGIESKIISPHVLFFVLIYFFAIRSLLISELAYAYAIFGYIQLFSIYFFGIYGVFIPVVLLVIYLATRKVFGRSYLYPLIPLNIKRLIKYYKLRKQA